MTEPKTALGRLDKRMDAHAKGLTIATSIVAAIALTASTLILASAWTTGVLP